MKMIRHVACALCAAALCFSAVGCIADETLGANEYIGENTNGAGGTIRVKVTMDGDKIAGIETIEQHETRGLGTKAIMELTETILSNNSTEVDDISGATLTSVAFKAAVRQAVETALGTDPKAGIELGENEYLGLSEHALGGRLVVKVTMDEGEMASIDILESHESADIGDPALETMKQRMLEANSASVDGVSGATISCQALCEAVTQALESAGM